MDKRHRWTNRLRVLIAAPAVLVVGLLVYRIVSLGMKYRFHLDFSQEYRQVKAVRQLRFWNRWDKKVYIRYPFGLRPIEKREDVPEEEKPEISWLDMSIYDVTYSGELVAWYDWKEKKIFLGSVEGEVQEAFDVLYHCEELAFSPDGRYLFSYEFEYGGEITDEGYCYYRVIDLEDGAQYTVYTGWREAFCVYWEKE